MQKAGAISRARLAAKVGRRCRVLLDSVEGGVAMARTAGDAPEIDGVVRVRTESGSRGSIALRSGEFAQVEIIGADTYDLEARLIQSPAASPSEASEVV
jgi:ribosomal protein S12 methylthiotransferase